MDMKRERERKKETFRRQRHHQSDRSWAVCVHLAVGHGTCELATKTNTPNTTCRSKTCPSPTICQLTNVVYEATCTLCQQTYIGQTRRKLHDRIREHTYSARKHDNTSAFGEHYANTHPNTTTPNITFKILKRTSDTLRLHIEEAYAIQTKSPQLNRRDEHLGMGFLI